MLRYLFPSFPHNFECEMQGHEYIAIHFLSVFFLSFLSSFFANISFRTLNHSSLNVRILLCTQMHKVFSPPSSLSLHRLEFSSVTDPGPGFQTISLPLFLSPSLSPSLSFTVIHSVAFATSKEDREKVRKRGERKKRDREREVRERNVSGVRAI